MTSTDKTYDMIFYFSGTGNTRWAAQQLACATGERLIFIPDELKSGQTHTYSLGKDERIGFCFPTHAWMPPRIVRRFVQGMTLQSDDLSAHYCYALCTCGDDIGYMMHVFGQDLRRKGLTLHSSFTLVMPESYVCLPFFDTDTPQKEQRKIAQAKADLAGFADDIVQRRKGLQAGHEGILPRTKTYTIGSLFNCYPSPDKPFHTDASLCIHCHRCAGACPIDNISFDNADLPVWAHNGQCTNCMACYHSCPRHAVGYWDTKGKGQYHFKDSKA